jgi:hypothetical protein
MPIKSHVSESIHRTKMLANEAKIANLAKRLLLLLPYHATQTVFENSK